MAIPPIHRAEPNGANQPPQAAAGNSIVRLIRGIAARFFTARNAPQMPNPLPLLARNSDLAGVRDWLANNELSEKDRGKAVWYAAAWGRLEILNELLASGLITEADRGEALAVAVARSHLDIVNALIANGSISNFCLRMATFSARYAKRQDIVQVLESVGDDNSYVLK